ncbi:MAG: hypothetical protein HXS48_18455 [Theionarchaea archaeon]|nr:hypothetical protein [Theionarchaea archaeon]
MSKKCIICGDEVTEEPDYMVFRCKVCTGGPCILFVPDADFLPEMCPFYGTNEAINELKDYVAGRMDLIRYLKKEPFNSDSEIRRLDAEYSMHESIQRIVQKHIPRMQPKWECMKGDL